MQPLRGYDSLSLGNLFQDAAPARLYPVDIQNTADGPYNGAPTPMAPRRRSGLTQERFLALKQAMRRIAPHVPPGVLQQHYINRLAELSNPTRDTLYPASSYEAGRQSDDTSGALAAPQSALTPQSAMVSPFVQAAMARFADSASRRVQPVSESDTPLSIGDLRRSIRAEPLSAPNVMEDPIIREARARFASSPAARGHVHGIPVDALVSADDARRQIGALAQPEHTTTAYPEGSKYGQTKVTSRWPHTMTERHLMDGLMAALGYADAGVRWVPVLGPIRDLVDDAYQGDVGGALIDSGMLVADGFGGWVLKAPLRAALKGLRKGGLGGLRKELEPWVKTKGSFEWNGTKEEDFKDGVAAWYKEMNGIPSSDPVHHWLVTQEMQRKWPWLFPKWLTNQPWNLMPMTRAAELGKKPVELHRALHGAKKEEYILDEDEFENLRKLVEYGRPEWTKLGFPTYTGMAAGNTAKAVRPRQSGQ